jgi:hypothetical protein
LRKTSQTTVEEREVLDLPLNGLNFSQLGLLQPGVVPITPGLAQDRRIVEGRAGLRGEWATARPQGAKRPGQFARRKLIVYKQDFSAPLMLPFVTAFAECYQVLRCIIAQLAAML